MKFTINSAHFELVGTALAPSLPGRACVRSHFASDNAPFFCNDTTAVAIDLIRLLLQLSCYNKYEVYTGVGTGHSAL